MWGAGNGGSTSAIRGRRYLVHWESGLEALAQNARGRIGHSLAQFRKNNQHNACERFANAVYELGLYGIKVLGSLSFQGTLLRLQLNPS